MLLEKLPWLEYAGQTTPELIACKNSHRIDSLLCAFEEGIQTKLSSEGEGSITGEERLVLAVMALDREVNNGGYEQFFANASPFVPIIVDALRRVECAATAAITERAISALWLRVLSADSVSAAILVEDPRRDEILTLCDNQFYELDEIGQKLFPFIEAYQDQSRLIEAPRAPPRSARQEVSNASTLYAHMLVTKKTNLSLDELRRLAQELARQNAVPATDAELEGATVLYAFGC